MINLSEEKPESGTELKSVSLYHFTSPDVAMLLANGIDFLGDEKGLVYFAEHPLHVDGARDMGALCSIQWPQSSDLNPFRESVKYESIDANDNVVEERDEFAPQYDYFAIPASIVKRTKLSVRCLGREERKALMT